MSEDHVLISVVFSKDRAMQLEAFLHSKELLVVSSIDDLVYVYYTASSIAHGKAYREVFKSYPWSVPRLQGSFKHDIVQLVPRNGLFSFFCDDQIFVRPWREMEAVPGLSLRLGAHLTMCYPTRQPQPLPTFRSLGEDRLTWSWADGHGDWGYPLSLDGHVFDAGRLREMVTVLNFNSPNSLEAALQLFKNTDYANARGICYHKSKVVNLPWNRVQTDWHNRSGQFVESSADALLKYWENGVRIDVTAYSGSINESCHQELPLILENR